MTIATALATPNLKRNMAALDRIVDRRAELGSRLRDQLQADYFYRAAIIVRNVLYRDWDVETVAFELSLLTGDYKTFDKQRTKRERMVKDERRRQKAKSTKRT